MASKITPEERQAIIADIKTGELSRNAIADKHGRSVGTITNIAKAAGLTDAFDRSATKIATEARAIDNRAKRTIEAAESISVAAQLRDRILDAKGGRDAQGWATAYGIMSDKHMAFETFDTDTGVDSARSMLGQLAKGLGAAYDALKDDTPGDES